MIFAIGLGSICLLLTDTPNPKVLRDSQRTCFREQKNQRLLTPQRGQKSLMWGQKSLIFFF